MVLHEQAEPDFVREHDIDNVTLDIIENALKNIRHEMDRVLVTTAVSPVIREQADEFPLIADRKGRMVVGQFGSPVDTVLENSPYTVEDLKDGDVIALNDPYMMEGSTSHLPDILLVRPIFYEEDHIGYALQWGNLMDVGGSTAGSIPIDARSIYEEGVRLPPVKLYDGGTLNEEVLRFFCHNSRTPRETRADVMAIAAGTAAGAQRVKDICDRFGKDTYLEACDALLARTRASIIGLIRQLIPEGERFEFEDYTDDDGLGNGPIKLKLAMWREGDSLHLDWTGTDAQVPGPVNFLLNKEMFQMFAGVFLNPRRSPDDPLQRRLREHHQGKHPRRHSAASEGARAPEQPPRRHGAPVRRSRRRLCEGHRLQRLRLLRDEPQFRLLWRKRDRRTVPDHGDPLRWYPGHTRQGRPRRTLLVARVPRRPCRVHGDVLPHDRGGVLGPQRLLRRRPVQGRLRDKEGLPFPGRGPHHLPGRPPPHLPLRRGWWQTGRGVDA